MGANSARSRAGFLFPNEQVGVEVYALGIGLDCWDLDWPHASFAARIFNPISQNFSAVQHLTFEHEVHGWSVIRRAQGGRPHRVAQTSPSQVVRTTYPQTHTSRGLLPTRFIRQVLTPLGSHCTQITRFYAARIRLGLGRKEFSCGLSRVTSLNWERAKKLGGKFLEL